MMLQFFLLLFTSWFSLALASKVSLAKGGYVGVNIGTEVSALPPAPDIVAILRKIGVKHVRLFDADREMLTAFANTGIEVIVGVPNNEILSVGQSRSTAAAWVNKNIAMHIPATNITAVAVGSEVLTSIPNAALVLVPAMKFIHSALVAANLDTQVKVSTPHSLSLILDPFPPSQAHFNTSFTSIMKNLLEFLQDTKSPFMVNIYPYQTYMDSEGVQSLQSALFQPISANQAPVDPNTMLNYTNIFDWEVDAAYTAMSELNVTGVPVLVTETGWPSDGDSSESDATALNADTYNANLIRHILNGNGTPAHPDAPVNTYIYELFNEDLRAGPKSERNWGIFNGNSTAVYNLRFDGSSSAMLANATSGSGGGNGVYCVAVANTDDASLQAGLDWACGPGGADCQAIQPGSPCYNPNTLQAHASYAFDSYFQKQNQSPGACDFKGIANTTTNDPSHESCIFPGSVGLTGSNGTLNGTDPFGNTTFPIGNATGGNDTFNSATVATFDMLLYSLVSIPAILSSLQIL